MARKGLLLISGLAMTFVLFCSVSCGAGSVSGKYVNKYTPNLYMELRADGTCSFLDVGDKTPVVCKWTLKGEEITLSWSSPWDASLPPATHTGKLQGNTITDKDGRQWVKQ